MNETAIRHFENGDYKLLLAECGRIAEYHASRAFFAHWFYDVNPPLVGEMKLHAFVYVRFDANMFIFEKDGEIEILYKGDERYFMDVMKSSYNFMNLLDHITDDM